MILVTLTSFLLSFSSVATHISAHPVHVSVTEIEYDEKSKALEIMMRVFADDLETSLGNDLNRTDLDLLNPSNVQLVDELVAAYIQKHFKISLDSKAQVYKYLGHEKEDNVFIFYIEVSGVKKWNTIHVTNDLFTEMFDDQSNLVHVAARGSIKSLRLTRETPSDKLSF